MVDALNPAPRRFLPDLHRDTVYYRLRLIDARGRRFRTYPPVRVPPSVEPRYEPDDPAATNTNMQMNAVESR